MGQQKLKVTVVANLRSLITLERSLVRQEEAELGLNLQAPLYAPKHKCMSSSTLRFLLLLHIKGIPVSVLHMCRSCASLNLQDSSTEVLGKERTNANKQQCLKADKSYQPSCLLPWKWIVQEC